MDTPDRTVLLVCLNWNKFVSAEPIHHYLIKRSDLQDKLFGNCRQLVTGSPVLTSAEHRRTKAKHPWKALAKSVAAKPGLCEFAYKSFPKGDLDHAIWCAQPHKRHRQTFMLFYGWGTWQMLTASLILRPLIRWMWPHVSLECWSKSCTSAYSQPWEGGVDTG